MTERHVGKKRRKEVREAANMKREINSLTRFLVIMTVIALFVCFLPTIFVYMGILTDDNMMVLTFLPFIFVFVLVMITGTRSTRLFALRKEYKDHCERFNISKDDIQALNNGTM